MNKAKSLIEKISKIPSIEEKKELEEMERMNQEIFKEYGYPVAEGLEGLKQLIEETLAWRDSHAK